MLEKSFRRSASDPGHHWVPYMVYKCCPGILKELWKILRIIWRSGIVAKQWRYSSSVCIPKEENSNSIEQFKTISLLNTDNKTLMGAMSRKLTKFVLWNCYIDTKRRNRRYDWLFRAHRYINIALEAGKGEQGQLGYFGVGSREYI